MSQPDKWFRWSFQLFVFLMCFQLGMLVFLKGLFYQAEQKLKDNQAEVDFRCEDFNDEKSYWGLSSGLSTSEMSCQEEHCPDSYWASSEPGGSELHVVSARKAKPTQKREGEVEVGYYIDVKVAASDRPQILALVSQSLLQWNLNFSEKSQVKEVLIIGPELVWVQGLPPGVKLTYFSPEQICAYPTAWQESKNPENEFRRLFRALETYTGLGLTSFQGQRVARKFQVPFLQSARSQERQLASEREGAKSSSGFGPAEAKVSSKRQVRRSDFFSQGLQWSREKRRLQAKSFQFQQKGKAKRVEVPQGTRAATYSTEQDSLFIIQHYRFGRWDWQKKQFEPIHLPLSLPAMRWPSLMVHDAKSGEILIYNEERGGEIYAYNPSQGGWEVRGKKLGYSLIAMAYLPEERMLVGARHKGQKIGSLVKWQQEEGALKEIPLAKEFDFLKSRWRASLLSDGSEYWLKLFHPAHPGGDLYSLSKVLSSAQ